MEEDSDNEVLLSRAQKIKKGKQPMLSPGKGKSSTGKAKSPAGKGSASIGRQTGKGSASKGKASSGRTGSGNRLPARAPSPNIIEISDTSTDTTTVQLDTPAIPHEKQTPRKRVTTLRKSLRIQVQGGSTSVLSKAKKRARGRDSGASGSSGMTLIRNFPYSRLTIEQIDDLFISSLSNTAW